MIGTANKWTFGLDFPKGAFSSHPTTQSALPLPVIHPDDGVCVCEGGGGHHARSHLPSDLLIHTRSPRGGNLEYSESCLRRHRHGPVDRGTHVWE